MLILEKTGCKTNIVCSDHNRYYRGPIFKSSLDRPYYRMEGGNLIRSCEIFVGPLFSLVTLFTKDKGMSAQLQMRSRVIAISSGLTKEDLALERNVTKIFL